MHVSLKWLGWFREPVGVLWKYYRQKPLLTLNVRGTAASSGVSMSPNWIDYTVWRSLTLHNDSPYPVRGIKLLKGFPSPWKLGAEIPTRIAADDKLTIQLTASFSNEPGYFGRALDALQRVPPFPKIIEADPVLEFQLENEKGRKFYQYTTFREDGSSQTEVLSHRR